MRCSRPRALRSGTDFGLARRLRRQGNRQVGAGHQEGRGDSRIMPRFAANLAYLFTERPLLERFGAAAAAGFKAVELQAPYDHTPAALKVEIYKHGLTQL